MKKLFRSQKGFTLIEILLVVAAIAILAGIVIVAINPGKQLGDTRNAQRRSDVTTILNAAYQYSIDNNGVLPAGVTASSTEICAQGAADCTGVIDLSVLALNGKYLVGIPQDPQKVTVNGTGYFIFRDANGRLTVTAPLAEQAAVISVTR
ncbi:MAG: ral secretion pathway protein [Patescibacteria group bacterium]|nr:ral secretion pathway protein [Patescibacteria group bacterium]